MWAIKDETIGTTFFDEGAARFFLRSAVMKGQGGRAKEDRQTVPVKGQGGRLDAEGGMAPLKRMQFMLDPTGCHFAILCMLHHDVVQMMCSSLTVYTR